MPQNLQRSFFPQGVHALPKILMPISGQLLVLGQFFQGMRFQDGVVILQVVENFGFEHEKPPVDPPFTDLGFFGGIMGWIVFAILGIALYGIGEVIWGKILSAESGRQISKQSFSWKRVGYGLFLYLGVLLIASGVYLFAQVR